jgi:hypothetical protein
MNDMGNGWMDGWMDGWGVSGALVPVTYMSLHTAVQQLAVQPVRM